MRGKLRGNPPLVLASFVSEILFLVLWVEAGMGDTDKYATVIYFSTITRMTPPTVTCLEPPHGSRWDYFQFVLDWMPANRW